MPSPGCLRNVLVATDFSDASETAVRWALAIARGGRARVSLVHVVHGRTDRALPPAVTAEVERRFAEDEARFAQEGVTTEHCVRAGKPWEVIVELAAEWAPDLIILGRRGRSTSTRVGLGSTADRVIRKAPAPVLAVRREDERAAGFDGPVVVATDFSEEADGALGESIRLVRTLSVSPRFLLLHACDFPMEYGLSAAAEVIATARAEEAAEATARLEEFALALRGEGLEVEVSVREGCAGTIIEERAQELGAGLIVLGTRGRSGLSHLMLGSVAERVLHHAPSPVLTVNRTAIETAKANGTKRAAG